MAIIKSLTLEGFKSFAKYTQFLFSPKFNVILGPNGSGKSNVTEALCFVLGRLGAKSLRAENSANLIYNGGKTKEPAKKAIVSIVFDNSKKEFPVDSDELKITRTVKQNGQSIYQLNGRRVTRQQIIDTLAYAKIDPNGYNIVLQGDINHFVNMSPLERRRIVEEIAGIDSYNAKKDKAVAELERVEGRIKEAEIILAERKNYLKDLKKQYDQALKYKQMKDNIRKNQATYLYLRIEKKKLEMNSLINQMKKVEEDIKSLKVKIEELRKKEKELTDKIKEISQKIETQGEESQVKIHKEVEDLKVKLAEANSDIDMKKKELERLKSRKEQLEKSMVQNKEAISQLNSEISNLRDKLENLKKDKEEVEKEIEAFQKEHDINKVVEIESNLDSLDSEVEKLNQEIKKIIEEKQNKLREKDKLMINIENIDSTIAKVKLIEKEHKKEIEELKKKKEEFKKIIKELNEALSKDSQLAAMIADSKRRVDSVREEVERLRVKQMQVQAKLNANLAVKAILDNKNKFGTVYGVVSQLAKVSKKYSTALSVAAGNRINSIVVDNDETAVKCINYLKRQKLGLATFLPLNKLRKVDTSNVKSLLKVNGVVGLASDLVVSDKKFNKVFSYVFGDTIVVEDLNVARRIGIGNARMVTLDGDLTEKSGAMHGGYRKKVSSSFQEIDDLSNADSLREKEKNLQKLEAELDELRADREANLENIERLRKLKGEFEGEIIKREKAIHLDDSDLDASQRRKALLKEQIKKLDKEIQELELKISARNDEIVKLKIKKQELKKQISNLRNPVIVAELTAFDNKRSELNDEIIRIEEKIKAKQDKVSALSSEIEETKRILKQVDKDKSLFSDELKKRKEEIKNLEKELAVKEKQQKEFYKKFKSLFEEKDKLNSELQNTTNLIVEYTEKVRNSEQKENNLSFRKAALSGELAGLEQEFKEFEGVELLKTKDEASLKYEIKKFEKLMENLGNVNLKALDVYEEVSKEYNDLVKKKEDLSKEREDVLKLIDEIETKKATIFLKTFDLVNQHFKSFFSKLSMKGEAFLKLENEENPFDGGVLIRVRITKQKFLDIKSLSGGEKTLTALALIFAIQEFQPASFYVLDEVDAALDKKNSEKLGELVKKYSEKAQYIVISHNDSIISKGDTLFGISMSKDGVSKMVSLKI